MQGLIRMLETVPRKLVYTYIENGIGKISDVDWLWKVMRVTLNGIDSNFA